MRDAIAVIGMAGRFPAAWDIGEFWRNLADGRDCLSDLDDDDLLRRGEYPDYLANPNYVRRRPCLPGAAAFDARCFAMTPREAEIRDPQQRVLLETAHSALEHAGYDPARYPGAIGVFAGTNTSRYRSDHLEMTDEIRQTVPFLALEIANAPDYVATFISHRLGLRGPSVTVQTACSTGLIAVHTACRSLAADECAMAVAGACSVEMPLDYGYLHLAGGILARDGTTRPFADDADGTNFGSAVGAVVLKRLDAALADGDTVLAVIRGSALNNDGDRKPGYTAPSVEGQAECIAEAIRQSGVDPRDISYVEAHGTATRVGDPIEVAGLTEAFRRAAGAPLPTGYCAIGSVKSNIGHSGQAAGICGFIKTVLALVHEQIPASIHVSAVNPRLELERTPFTVATDARPWPRTPGRPRRAGVSSFGIGGTNAHVVLEEAPARADGPAAERDSELIVWSAATAAATEDFATRLAHDLADAPPASFGDLAYTLRVGRTQRAHRRALVARDAADAARRLRDGEGLIAPDGPRREVVFCFPGQGAQHPGMAHSLYRREPTFRARCDELFDDLAALVDRDLRDLWLTEPEAPALVETAVAQPLLFVIEYALARTLMDWSVRPTRLIGHSVGELVAATVAGVFSPAAGLRVIAARADAMRRMPAGRMLAVAAAPDRVRECLAGLLADDAGQAAPGGRDSAPGEPGTAAVAAINGERQVVLSGPADAIALIREKLGADGIASTPLNNAHAFHSPAMAPAAERFTEALAGLALNAPAMPVVSCATGQELSAEEATSPAFWAAQLVRPVLFADAVHTVLGAGPAFLLETGPGRTLSALLRGEAVVRRAHGVPLPVLDTGPAAAGALDRTLGRLWVEGHPVDLARRDAVAPRRRVPAPGYAYQRREFWIERPPHHMPHRDNAIVAGSTEAPPAVSGAATSRPAPPEVTAAPPDGSPRWTTGTLDWTRVRDGREPAPRRRSDDAVAVLVLPPRGGPAGAVRGAFQRLGFHTVRASLPTGEPAGPAVGAVLDPGADEAWDELLRRGADAGPLSVVAYAALFGAPSTVDLADLDRQLHDGVFGVLACARAVARGRPRPAAPVTLLLLTSHAVDVTGAEPVNPATAMVNALARSVEQEHPGIRCVVVDAPADTAEDVLSTALTGSWPLVALRGTAAWTPVLRPAPPPPGPGHSRLRERGVYLVTGGLGGLGLVVAEALAETGLRPRLALLGRGGAPPADTVAGAPIARALATLAEAGAEVLTLSGDVADPAALERAVRAVEERFGTVHGVVHAAGVPGGGLFERRSRADVERVLRPKAHGTLALQACFAGRPPLDFLVLFSSQASLTGMLGSADYAAANGFLNAYAQLHGRGPGWVTAVAWPAWSETGMWARSPVHGAVDSTGTVDSATDAPEPDAREHADAAEPTEPQYRRHYRTDADWELDEHRFAGVPLLPGTGFLELVVTAARAVELLPDTAPVELRETVFVAPLEGTVPVEARVRFTPVAGQFRFRVQARPAGTQRPWTNHVTGQVAGAADRPGTVDLAELTARLAPSEVPRVDGWMEFGPRWRSWRALWRGDDEHLAELELPEPFHGDLAAHPLHAALLDQAGIAILTAAVYGDGTHYLPFLYRRLVQFAELPARVLVHGRVGPDQPGIRSLDLDLYDPATGRQVVRVTGYTFREVRPDEFGQRLSARKAPATTPRPAPAATTRPAPAEDPPAPAVAALRPRDGAAAFLAVLDGGYPPVVLIDPPGARLTVAGLPWAGAPTAPPATVEPTGPAAQATPAAVTEPAAPPVPAPAPGDDVQETLRKLWIETLGVDDAGPDDDFFELGGDSLVSVQLSARIRQLFNVDVGAGLLFEASTIRRLADELAALGVS